MLERNKLIPMTRRYPDLKNKVLARDSKIIKTIIHAWDVENDREKVLRLFIDKRDKLSDYRYWEIMRTVWIVCGGLNNIDVFRKLFQSNRKHKYYFSTPEEQARLKDMDDEMLVYRACNEENDGGVSWTLSKEYAHQYRKDFDKKMVISKMVLKEDIFALIERNAEEEILIL